MTDIVELARNCGAKRAAVIPVSEIVLSKEFRRICESNSCGFYNRCWMCPPDAGDIETLMQTVSAYSEALLYQSVGELEDSFDIEGMQEAGKNHILLSLRIGDAISECGLHDTLHLSAGGCHLCEVCAKVTNEPCRHPDRALPSLESYGVDVYNTAKNAELPYINGKNTVTYFGMVLLRKHENG